MALFKVIDWLDDNNKWYMMNNVFHKKGWGTNNKPAHVEPLPIPLMKETSTSKSDGDYVKLKLRRDPT